MRHGEKMKRRTQGISAAAKECLMRYDWPGNVRELQSAIESAMALGSTDLILAEDLPEPVLPGEAADDALPRFNGALVEIKRDLIRKAYQQAHGDYAAAAKALGLHPNSLLRLVRTLGLRSEIRRPGGGS
jgi:transcriptional regulator with PAS, ATPase and Fis domain